MADFYRELAVDYHLLFPARQAQIEFLCGLVGDPPARVVDVASGTGEYAAALTELHYEAFGLEIDYTMWRAAQVRHHKIAHRMIHGDMLELMDDVRGPARLVFCIGNSLPHLASFKELAEALSQMWDMTRPGGTVAVQVVNFDRVLATAVEDEGKVTFDLPMLSNTRMNGLRVDLERRYEIPLRRADDDSSGVPEALAFHSTLYRPGFMRKNSLNLLVITQDRLAAAIPAGVKVAWYGDFAGADWSAESPATIAVLS